jgi:hypothetical protein
VIAGTRLGVAGGGELVGKAILNLAAGDVLTVVNNVSNGGSTTLTSSAGGSQTTVDASIVIEKLA